MGSHHQALTGVSAPLVTHCLTRCSSPLLPHSNCRLYEQQCRVRRPNGVLGRRLCQGVTRQCSISAWFTTTRDRGCRPHDGGLAQHPLSEGSMVLDLAAWLFKHCISIIWHLTETLSCLAFVPPAVSECVHVMPPAE